MTFSIDEVYKAGVPRGQFYRSSLNTLSNTETDDVVVSPATSPENHALLCDKIKFLESSLTTSGTGTGILNLEYPTYSGTTTNNFLFESINHLKALADEIITVNSSTYIVWKPQPPILLKASNDYSDLTFSIPTDVTIDSGSLDFMLAGWTLKEADFD